MKSIKTLLFSSIICFVIILTTTSWSEIQQGKKDTIITVSVNTALINQSNKNIQTIMYDDRGGSSTSGNHANYVSLIDIDKRAIWVGQVQNANQNPNDRVLITMVSKKNIAGNKSLLKKDVYTGNGQVDAKVRRNYEDGEEAYDITFTVIRNGQATSYTIDPKLKMNPS